MTYRLEYLNRRGAHSWCIPLAGTTATRDSALVPANLGRAPLSLPYSETAAMADRLNGHLALMGMPGRVFAVLDAPCVDLMAGCREVG